MMKDSKYSKVRPSTTWRGMLRGPRSKPWNKLHFNVGLVILVGVSLLVLMFGRENGEGSPGLIGDFRRMISPIDEKLLQPWNYTTFSFRPNVSDWDEQRATWMNAHPTLRVPAGERPRVLLVTGSPPNACDPIVLSHLLLRAAKNKVDYSRIHHMDLFYNMGNSDPEFSDWWMKLPTLRMLMLGHPEVEWIWWIDADAVFTDMSFEPPLADLEHANLILYGEERLVYDERSWKGLSTAQYLIRNCQWSLDLLDAWASMGTISARVESGLFESELLDDRPFAAPGDDQSSLLVLLAQDKTNPIGKQRWAPMVKLVKETEYAMNGNWTVVGPKLEELMNQRNGQSLPFVTHFKGCLPSCTVKPELSTEFLDMCVEQLGRAFDFADNQVYAEFGFEPRKLGTALEPLTKKAIENVDGKQDMSEKEYRIPPKFNDWDERRLVWMQKYPPTKRDEVLLLSGSAPKPCTSKLGSHLLLRGLKNLIDYSRLNDIRMFYNAAAIDKNLTGWWSKLPLLKMMMMHNPGVEWIWWLDSDATFTNMDYRLEFERFNAEGYNIVMYGSEHELYDKKSYIGINTGNFLIRNCQWSLDLLDRWASFGATKELRVKNEQLLNNFLSDRPHGWAADDQCVLVYVLITEREKWGPKVYLENGIVMSGYWKYWDERYDGIENDRRPEDRPFVSHFAGCKPCVPPTDPVLEACLVSMDRTYNFGDNQVLEKYGFRHKELNSSELQKFSHVIDNVLVVEKEAKQKVDTSEESNSVTGTKELAASEEVLDHVRREVEELEILPEEEVTTAELGTTME